MTDAAAARVGVDVGGTFTDVVLVADGVVTTAKVPTTPDDQSVGVLRGIERACEDAGVDPAEVEAFRHGTTVATNALLEGEGADAALVTTAGFRDVPAIGRQDRPALYDPGATKPAPLVPRERRFELPERAMPDGIEEAVDPADVRAVAAEIPDAVEGVAVCLLHAYAHPANERRAACVLRDELDATVVASHEVLGTFREYERTSTTAADAVLTPVVDAYLGRLVDSASARGLPEMRIMQSNGGIADAATVREHAVRTALSGPAAGVVGAALFEPADSAGVVSFDMGGTSTDVGLVRDGEVERTAESAVGGHPIGLSMVDVETAGAGGGSIARVDAGGALRVGPESAGADPGPACYGRGGEEPTVTDACLVLGYLGARLGGDVRLDADAADAVLEGLADSADLDGPIAAARGVYRVATARMARAIRTVTVERGHDPRDLDLVAFGGAGPLFAAALADRLGAGTVRVPRANGVLSALGLLAADESHDAVRTHRTPLDDVDESTVASIYADLVESVRADASDPETATIARRAALRYAGQSHELTVAVDEAFDPDRVAERFGAAHERVRGYRMDEPVELVSLGVTATIGTEPPPLSSPGEGGGPVGTREAVFESGSREASLYDRATLETEATIHGPAICEGGESTVLVPPGWRAAVDDRGTLVLEAAA